jgi:hypothetical protein
VGIARDLPDAPEATGREEHGFGVEHVDVAGLDIHGDDAGADTVVGQQEIEHHELVEEGDLPLERSLVERLKDHVAGTISRIASPAHWTLTEVTGVTTEAPLIDPTIRCPVEGKSPMLEFDDGVDRLAGEDFGRVLIDEVVAALHGVEHMPDPVVLLDVPEGSGDPTLSSTGVRANRIQFADDGHIAFAGQLCGSHQASTACANDDRIETMEHHGSASYLCDGFELGWVESHDRDRADDQKEKGQGPEDRMGEHAPTVRTDIIIDGETSAVQPMRQCQEQQQPVVHAPERRIPPVGHELPVDFVDRVHDVHDHDVSNCQKDQQESTDPEKIPAVQLESARRSLSSEVRSCDRHRNNSFPSASLDDRADHQEGSGDEGEQKDRHDTIEELPFVTISGWPEVDEHDAYTISCVIIDRANQDDFADPENGVPVEKEQLVEHLRTVVHEEDVHDVQQEEQQNPEAGDAVKCPGNHARWWTIASIGADSTRRR